MICHLLTFVLLALLLMTVPPAVHSDRATVIVRVLGPYAGNPKNEVWVQSMLPPHFTFRVEQRAMPVPGVLRYERLEQIQSTPDGRWK